MAYKENPELFELHKCEWLGLFKDFSNNSFTFSVPKKNKIKEFLHKCKHPTEFIWFRKINYAFRTYLIIRKSKQRG